MKNFYFAVTVEENDKFYSYVLKVGRYNNIINQLKIPGIKCATICPTKKDAEQIVNQWNACYRANNEYLFNSPAF